VLALLGDLHDTAIFSRVEPKGIWSSWADDDGNVILVRFDDEHVTGKRFVQPSLSEQIRRRIERRLQALRP
jgi:hypothetical protein